MARKASRTTAKSKIKFSATKYNGESLTFVTESPNPEIYFVNLRIQSECGKIRTRNNSVFGHFSHSG